MTDWVVAWRFKNNGNGQAAIVAMIAQMEKQTHHLILPRLPSGVAKEERALFMPQAFDSYAEAESHAKATVEKLGRKYVNL